MRVNNNLKMEDGIEIKICLGSSCFARGNKKSVNIIMQYIKEHKLSDKIYFHGGHCFGHCERGPSLQIGEEIIDFQDPENLIELLDKKLLTKIEVMGKITNV